MNGMNEMQDNKMLDLYVERYEDSHDCETCGCSSSTIYSISEKPFDDDVDMQLDDVVSFGDYAACFDSKDGSFDDVVNYINKTYSKNIDLSSIKYPEAIGMSFDECEQLFDGILIGHFKDVHGINLTITHDEAEAKMDWDDDYIYDWDDE